MQQTLIIGDIHGCYAELQALLDKAGLGDGDALIGNGDILDRGPETPQVVAFFQSTPNAQAIMGNHERKHVRAARHEVKLSISQKISRIQLGPAYPEAVNWMASLPLYIELEQAILIHGYFEPGIPPERQNPSVLCGTMGGDQILRRHYDRPWYELYDGEKALIVGHHNYTDSEQPFVYHDKVFGLDTDCVTGKSLTGILLPSFQFVSVPSRDNLWMQVRRSYHDPKPPPPPPKVLAPLNEEQNQQLKLLFQTLQKANQQVQLQVQETPGYAALKPRQQAKRYSELIGTGPVPILLHRARTGQLNLDHIREIVKDPDQLGQLIETAARFTANLDTGV